MGAPTRYPNGVTNVTPIDPLNMFLLPDPTAVHMFFTDFDYYNANDWIVSTTEDGNGTASEVLADADGGVLKVTNDDKDDDNDFFQWSGDEGAGSISETFTMESGKKGWFKARLKTNDATQSDIIVGLYASDTSPLDSLQNGIWFQKDDGDANIDCYVASGGTSTSDTAISTMSDDTYVVLAWYYNGDDKIECFVDGSKKATLATTNLPSTELAVSFGIQNGEGAAKELYVDYILVAKER